MPATWTPEVPRPSWVTLGKVLHCLVSNFFICKVEITLFSTRGGCWRMNELAPCRAWHVVIPLLITVVSFPPAELLGREGVSKGDMCPILKVEGER